MLERAQASCRQLLAANRARLDAMATRLLEREAISGDELKELLGARLNEFALSDRRPELPLVAQQVSA